MNYENGELVDQQRIGTQVVPDNALVGRVFMDLSNAAQERIQVPATAMGLSILWMADNAGNAPSGGPISIYIGDVGAVPWIRLSAPATTLVTANGPLPRTIEHGTYLTFSLGAASKGLLIFEFLSGPLSRTYTSV